MAKLRFHWRASRHCKVFLVLKGFRVTQHKQDCCNFLLEYQRCHCGASRHCKVSLVLKGFRFTKHMEP
ncbi:hypothetical protein SLE2022_399360 [Rubroshorea leprosula]